MKLGTPKGFLMRKTLVTFISLRGAQNPVESEHPFSLLHSFASSWSSSTKRRRARSSTLLLRSHQRILCREPLEIGKTTVELHYVIFLHRVGRDPYKIVMLQNPGSAATVRARARD